MHHLLVEHRVGVADYEAGPNVVELARLLLYEARASGVSITEHFGMLARLPEEHTIELDAILRLDPMVFSIELSLQDEAQLFDLAEQDGVLATA